MNRFLKSKIPHALSWSFLERGGEQGIRFVVSVILARILFPEQFGLIAVLTIFIVLAGAFNNCGQALIEKPDISYVDRY